MLKINNLIPIIKALKVPVILLLVIISLGCLRHYLYHFYQGLLINLILFLLQIILFVFAIILAGEKFKIIYLYLAISLLTVELYARCFYQDKSMNKNYLTISKIENFQLPFKIKKNNNITPTELKYYEYFLFAPYPGTNGEMSISDNYSARKSPDSEERGKGKIIIWTFGGSTMLNIETSDRLSIANQVALNLKKRDFHPVILNFGMWGFQSSLENIKFQELLKHTDIADKPDIVIFYDGYNDAGFTYWFGAGKMSFNSSNKIKAIVEGEYPRLAVFSIFKFLCNISKFWEYFIEPSFNSDISLFGGYSGKSVNNDPENLIRGVKIYETNTRIIRSVCREFGIKPFFILQPMIFTKKNLTDFEKQIVSTSLDTNSFNKMNIFYTMTKQIMKKYHDFYDYTAILDNSRTNDFYDLGHIGPFTGIKIGKAITDTLIHHLQDSTIQQNVNNHK